MKRMQISQAAAAELRGDVDQVLDDVVASLEDVASCVRCGCTDRRACRGGCFWIATRSMEDVCSACATPAELRAAGYLDVVEG